VWQGFGTVGGYRDGFFEKLRDASPVSGKASASRLSDGPTLEQNCTPWEGPTLGQLVKSCSPWEGLTLEKFVEKCLL